MNLHERWARRGVLIVILAVAACLTAGPAESASSAGSGSGAAKVATRLYGAGTNAPSYNDAKPIFTTSCFGEGGSGIFKVNSAKIVMWSRGERIKGFQMKYRLVPSGTDGMLQTSSNWSANVSTSFNQGTTQTTWMKAGALGQSFGTGVPWDIEIKLKYPRSLRTAFRFKYRRAITNPDCGLVLGSDNS
jgi:hypothetical protein